MQQQLTLNLCLTLCLTFCLILCLNEPHTFKNEAHLRHILWRSTDHHICFGQAKLPSFKDPFWLFSLKNIVFINFINFDDDFLFHTFYLFLSNVCLFPPMELCVYSVLCLTFCLILSLNEEHESQTYKSEVYFEAHFVEGHWSHPLKQYYTKNCSCCSIATHW